MWGHRELFLMLYEMDEGDQNVYACRICQMTPNNNSGIRTETDWIRHLASDYHQHIHRSHQLLRKALWDLDRTVAVTNVQGIGKLAILNYLVQLGCQIVDFSYLSVSDGGTAACYALLSSTWVFETKLDCNVDLGIQIWNYAVFQLRDGEVIEYVIAFYSSEKIYDPSDCWQRETKVSEMERKSYC